MTVATKTMSAGEVAALTGVSKDTLRHYERQGLLSPPPRSGGGYRLYSAEHVERVLLIRKALGIGFSLDEVNGFLAIRDSGGAPCRQVRGLLSQKLDELDRRILELQGFREEVSRTLLEWDAKLLQSGPGVRAGLLESLQPAGSSRTTK